MRRELAQGAVLTSLVGYTLELQHARQQPESDQRQLVDLQAGLRRRRRRREISSARRRTCRTYYEVLSGRRRHPAPAGRQIITGWGGRRSLRMLDHFQMGPNLVRGFAPSGIGPRDLTQFNFNGTHAATRSAASMYWGASLEFQTPLYFLPKDSGVKVAAFADAGSLWNYIGPTTLGRSPARSSRQSARRHRAVRQRHASSARRSASACSGHRRSVRFGSISHSR